MEVQVVPKQSFLHDSYDCKKGVAMPMSVVQARLLRDAGLVEEFDDTQTAEDAEAEAKAAAEHANKQLAEPDNKSQPSVKVNHKKR